MDQKQGVNLGQTFLSKTGLIDANPIKSNKVTCLYFSASWCPPCQAFTPLLSDFYQEVNRDEKQLEIVWVSHDKTEEEYKKYFKSMSWLAIPFGDKRIEELTQHFNIKGIPVLLVLKPNGEIATKQGKQDVATEGEDAFKKWLDLVK